MAASQTVPQLAVVVSVPKPVPKPISQEDLETVILLRNALRQRKAQLEAIEADLQARLEAGGSVEEGVHTAELKESFRRNVAWKDVVVRLAERLELDGEAYCANVLNHTKPTRTVSLDVH